MVIRRGPKRFLIPVAFYLAATASVAYFLYHAHHGARGLETKQELKTRIADFREDLTKLKADRQEWEQRVALMRREEVDRDFSTNAPRAVLGRVHPNDVVIIGR